MQVALTGATEHTSLRGQDREDWFGDSGFSLIFTFFVEQNLRALEPISARRDLAMSGFKEFVPRGGAATFVPSSAPKLSVG